MNIDRNGGSTDFESMLMREEMTFEQSGAYLRIPSPSHLDRIYLVPVGGGPICVVEAKRPAVELDTSAIVSIVAISNASPASSPEATLIRRFIEQDEPLFLRLARPLTSTSEIPKKRARRLSGKTTWRLLRPGD